MKNSIEEFLLPVRVRVDYIKGERIVYLECANGEVLTVNLPFAWAQFMAFNINRQYFSRTNGSDKASNPVAVLRINGLPMQRSETQIVVPGNNGNLIIQENPAYTESIREAGLLGEELFLERYIQLPIKEPINICCIYNITGRERYNIARANAWVLDLLDRLNIIQGFSHRIVKSMNGSKVRVIKEEPFILIIIRKLEG